MAKIDLKSITVSTDDSALFTSFAAASKHIQQLAETYDHCKVLLQWEDLSTHEVEYDLCRDPFQYDLTKRVKHYLEHAIKADANVINAFEIDVAAIQKLIEGYQLEDKIKVTRTQFQDICDKEWTKILDHKKAASWNHIFDRYEIVLEFPPNHANPDINDLINAYCGDSRIKSEGVTIYTGGQVGAVYCDTFGRPRLKLPASPEFKFIDEWCNGYREVFISEKDYVTLTICEGDLTIKVCEDQAKFAAELADAIECYGNTECFSK